MYPILRYKQGKLWELVEDFTKDGITVPAGFIYDLASIPRALWWLLPPFGTWLPATTIHDYNYRTKRIPRKDADNMMYRMLINDGVNRLLSLAMYQAVKTFGKNRYGRGNI